MFRRPTDPPDVLPPLRGSEHILRLHAEWSRMHAGADDGGAFGGRLRNRVGLVARLAGGADHRLLGDLIRAVDAVAGRVDELAERVHNLSITADDIGRALSEVAELRTDIERLTARETNDPLRPPE